MLTREKSKLNLPIVWLMSGLPRSGKSTYAKEKGFLMVNRDSIRLALHGKAFDPKREDEVTSIENTMVMSLLIAGHSEITIDATHIGEGRKDRWRNFLKGKAQVTVVTLDTSEEECIKRAIISDTEYLVPVIKRMAENMRKDK